MRNMKNSSVSKQTVPSVFLFLSLFKSKLVSRKSKLKLYRTIIRPVAVYGCETWVFKESIIQRLSVFERKIRGLEL